MTDDERLERAMAIDGDRTFYVEARVGSANYRGGYCRVLWRDARNNEPADELILLLVAEVRRLRGELEWLRGEEATAAERVARVPPFDLVRLRAIASPTEGAVRAAVAAERERCAGVADAEAAVWRSMVASGLTSWDIGSVLVELAAAIRRGPEPTTEGV